MDQNLKIALGKRDLHPQATVFPRCMSVLSDAPNNNAPLPVKCGGVFNIVSPSASKRRCVHGIRNL
jgi:hypothetical protein